MAYLRRHMPALWLLAAAVLMVRALVPSGWMPSVEDGGVRIVLCTGQGPVMATLERDGQIRHDGGEHTGGEHTEGTQDVRDTCPFGTVAQPFHPPAPVALPGPLPLAAPLDTPAPAVALIAARKALRPPARGPPAFA
ncbi:MAG: DUF2946 family protein [Novosphingobium sp.]|nr:DUF2946 family protein [Novosphingobium sp.]